MTDHTAPTDPSQARTACGFVALMGAPNAGKSTLANALVGQKVSIVSHKVQTTRFPVRGVAMHEGAQLILVDTPGVFEPKRRLDRAMVASAWSGAADADVLVHVVDAAAKDTRTADDAERVREGLKRGGRKALLSLNKIDLVPRPELLDMAERAYDTGLYDEVVMISALKSDGLGRLKDLLARRLPEGPWLYPEDQAADIPMRLMAAEITREKVFARLHEELPYQTTVETEQWTERPDGSVRIDQTLYVARPGHKGIALGKNGETLKWISRAARLDIAAALERTVHLFVHVKVREAWQDERPRYQALGLDFDA